MDLNEPGREGAVEQHVVAVELERMLTVLYVHMRRLDSLICTIRQSRRTAQRNSSYTAFERQETRFRGRLPEIQGQNLALTVLHAP